MIHDLQAIAIFVGRQFAGIWPYLLLTIPLAVAVRVSGAARHLERVLGARPVAAILLATAVGAFSPFCSCSVVPVVASLLIGGVPLGPVMSFWIASPSMDPEMFLLSVASLGWELALWRLGATLVLSLAAGFTTQWVWTRGLLGAAVLKPAAGGACSECGSGRPRRPRLRERLRRAVARVRAAVAAWLPALAPAPASAACCGAVGGGAARSDLGEVSLVSIGRGPAVRATEMDRGTPVAPASPVPASLLRTVARETVAASLMVGKFMAIAFLLEALFELYVPAEWIAALASAQGPLPVLYAALVGVPLYTSNLAALPLIARLLEQGMAPAAALAFLIAGPTTTLPAMAAVWGLVNRRVFALYVGFAFVGALAAGWAWSFWH